MNRLFSFLLAALFIPAVATAQKEDSWNVYMGDFEGKPGSVMFNESLAERAPVRGFRFVVSTGLPYSPCREDGLPEGAAFDDFERIEEGIVKAIGRTKDQINAGSFTYDCQRLHYIYIKDTVGLRGRLERFYQQSYPGKTPWIAIRQDTAWAAYLEFLYPNEETRQYMADEKVVARLEDAGDSLVTPRNVDHWIYFGRKEDAACLTAFLRANGYAAEPIEKTGGGSLAWKLRVHRTDPVTLEHIYGVIAALRAEVRKCGGEYDGWETEVIR